MRLKVTDQLDQNEEVEIKIPDAKSEAIEHLNERCKILINLIKSEDTSLNIVYKAVFKAFQLIENYAEKNSSSAVNQFYLFTIERYTYLLINGYKHSILTKDHILEMVEVFNFSFEQPEIFKIMLEGLGEYFFESQYDKIWRTISNAIRRDIKIVSFWKTKENITEQDNNILDVDAYRMFYQTSEHMNKEVGLRIINALKKIEQEAMLVPYGQQDDSYYVLIPLSLDLKSDKKPLLSAKNIVSLLTKPSDFKEDESESITSGTKVINKIRESIGTIFNIDKFDKYLNISKENFFSKVHDAEVNCNLLIFELWKFKINKIIEKEKPIIDKKIDKKKQEIIRNVAREVVLVQQCSYALFNELAYLTFYQLSQIESLLPLDLFYLLEDKKKEKKIENENKKDKEDKEDKESLAFVVTKRDLKKDFKSLKDMDTWNKDAVVIDSFLKICCSARFYRSQKSLRFMLLTTRSKKGFLSHHLRIENKHEADYLHKQVKSITALLEKNKSRLPECKPMSLINKLKDTEFKHESLCEKLMNALYLIQECEKLTKQVSCLLEKQYGIDFKYSSQTTCLNLDSELSNTSHEDDDIDSDSLLGIGASSALFKKPSPIALKDEDRLWSIFQGEGVDSFISTM